MMTVSKTYLSFFTWFGFFLFLSGTALIIGSLISPAYPTYVTPCLVYGLGMIVGSILIMIVLECTRESINRSERSDLTDINQYETTPLLIQ